MHSLETLVEHMAVKIQTEPTGKEASLEYTQEQSKVDQVSPVLNKAEANHSDTPDERYAWQENPRSNFSENDSGWWLQQHICYEENQDDDRISFADKDKINAHTSDDSDTQIGAIHQRYTVQEAEGEYKSSVDMPNDPLLFFWRKGIDALIQIGVGLVRVINGEFAASVCSLEFIHTEFFFHGCVGSHSSGVGMKTTSEETEAID